MTVENSTGFAYRNPLQFCNCRGVVKYVLISTNLVDILAVLLSHIDTCS